MENNRLLIGVQFTGYDGGEQTHLNLELYVLRDMTLLQLLDGVKFGLAKLINEGGDYRPVYARCSEIYNECMNYTKTDDIGQEYFTHITLTQYFRIRDKSMKLDDKGRFVFLLNDLARPICDLGFINSTKLIFDATGGFVPYGMFNTANVIDAFNPIRSKKIFYPEYNISSRQLYEFNTEPVNVIAPTDPPKKNDNSLFALLMPSILSIGVMAVVRGFFMSGSRGSRISMLIMSIAMGIVAVITTINNWRKQKAEFKKTKEEWKNRYEDYINDLMAQIRSRQSKDVQLLREIYPDVEQLIEQDVNGIYSLKGELYSRSAADSDFLSFRMGLSNDVESLFKVNGDEKDAVFSEADFSIDKDTSGNDRLHIYVKSDGDAGKSSTKNLCRLPFTLKNKYRFLKDAPLLYSLKDKGMLGIVDPDMSDVRSRSNAFISRMIFELCYYHSPEELQFVIFFPESSRWDEIENEMDRYKYMPHFRGLFDDKSQFVFDAKGAGLIMSSLLTIIGSRRNESRKDAGANLPHIVMIVMDEHGLKEHAFAEFLPKAPEEGRGSNDNYGLSFVFVKDHKEYLPAYCDDVIYFSRSGSFIVPRGNADEMKNFVSPYNREKYIDYTKNNVRAFRFFSSVFYAQIAQNGKVPSAVSLFELFDLKSSDEVGRMIASNWGLGGRRSVNITESLAVPVGKTETGMSYLDLHEKGDGPHMLVAGTTGSGKTETIISYLLALCTTFRPDELNLLLVDMKGGGFTKRIGKLPHVVGTVTDVDGDENGTGAEYMLGRFLFAIKAEIKRRKILFNKLHVDNIDDYISACAGIDDFIAQKKFDVDEAQEIRRLAMSSPLPHLILVVDEFTELKRFTTENSDIDFIGEITTIARVGRSLGLHIILISQNIEGAITDDIRVNSRARLCLKVATRQASKEMIGTELAASPSMPGNGRAYLLVGTGSKFEYFQSGYSGTSSSEDIPVEIRLASKTGAYGIFYNSRKDNTEMLRIRENAKKEGKIRNQLEITVDGVSETFASSGIRRPHVVFRNPLPRVLSMNTPGFEVERETQKKELESGRFAMGVCDLPQEQAQPPFYLDHYKNNTMIFGKPMSGKTLFLKTLLARLSYNEDGPEESVYIIDFAGGLGDFSRLGIVCACFNDSNEENIKRIFSVIESRIAENTKRLEGKSYYQSFLKAENKKNCLPHITLIIENINAFLLDERYQNYADRLSKLCRDGISKGLSVVVTANDTAGLNRLSSFFAQKVAFEMPAESYIDIFNTKVNIPVRNPGRGILGLENSIMEFQCFIPFDDHTEDDEEQMITLLAERNPKENNPNVLRSFPEILTKEMFPDYCTDLDSIPETEIVVGLDYYDHTGVGINIMKQRAIAIYGKRQFGKTNLLYQILDGIRDGMKVPYRIVYLDDGREELTGPRDRYSAASGCETVYIKDISEMRDYLRNNGYGGSIRSNETSTSLGRNANSSSMAPIFKTPFTVFVIQSKMIYQSSLTDAWYLANKWFPEMIGNAEERNYLFLFTDVRKTSESIAGLNSSFSAAFLLDNIAEFVVDKGQKSVFGEMDARELKTEYARCSLGDGYYYEIEADRLQKVKFLKN